MTHFNAGTMKADGVDGSDSKWDDIDLGNEPDWAGYDEDKECAVGAYDIKT